MTEPRKGKRVEILDALKVERATYKELRSEGSKNAGALLGNRLPDGRGLYLFITPTGAKSWRFDYRFPKGGKRHVVVYGAWPDVSLSEARKKHDAARLQLANGLNPAAEKKKQNELTKAAQDAEQKAKKNTFRGIGAEWYEKAVNKRKKENRPYSEAWEDNTTRWLGWAYDDFGNRPIGEIEAPDVLALIERVAAKAPRSGEECRQLLARIFDYGIATLRAPKGFNPARAIQGAVMVPDRVHHPKLEAKHLPKFLADIEAHDGREALKIGLKVLLHCFPRKRELCEAPWTEIDFGNALWSIDKGRTKSRNSKNPRDHLIPLSSQVLAMFRRLKELAADSPYVLPSIHWKRREKPVGELALNQMLEAIGYSGEVFVPHGARATAISILQEAGWDEALLDLQLGHKPPGGTKPAYFRGSVMEQRRKLMQAWSDMLDAYAAGGSNVVPINAVKAA